MAADWWDPKGPCSVLHAINPVRLQFISDRFDYRAQPILDLGCGGGILSQSLAERGAKVTGLDVVPELLAVARTQVLKTQNTRSLNLDYVEDSAQNYAFKHPASFEAITCMELLEHVPDPSALLQACATLLKPGAKLFLSTLNRHPKAYLVAILGAEYVFKKLPKNTHHYEKWIRPSELDRWLRASGFRLRELCGIRYNPFTHHVKLCKDVSVNYLAYATLDAP